MIVVVSVIVVVDVAVDVAVVIVFAAIHQHKTFNVNKAYCNAPAGCIFNSLPFLLILYIVLIVSTWSYSFLYFVLILSCTLSVSVNIVSVCPRDSLLFLSSI